MLPVWALTKENATSTTSSQFPDYYKKPLVFINGGEGTRSGNHSQHPRPSHAKNKPVMLTHITSFTSRFLTHSCSPRTRHRSCSAGAGSRNPPLSPRSGRSCRWDCTCTPPSRCRPGKWSSSRPPSRRCTPRCTPPALQTVTSRQTRKHWIGRHTDGQKDRQTKKGV